MNRKRELWTEKEIEFLKVNYPSHGGRYCADFLNKKIKSIQSKAESLSLQSSYKWKSEDISFLKENYSKMGVKYCANKIGKDLDSIKHKAMSL